MICKLLALAEITHELTKMQDSSLFSIYCDLLADRCCDLRYSLKALYKRSDKESDYGTLVLKTYTLAKTLQFFLARSRPEISERDIV